MIALLNVCSLILLIYACTLLLRVNRCRYIPPSPPSRSVNTERFANYADAFVKELRP